MNRLGKNVIISLTLVLALAIPVSAQTLLIPVGKVVGLQLRTEEICVAAYDDLLGKNARDAGLKIGDVLLTVNGREISGAEAVAEALEPGQAELTVRRGGRVLRLQLPCVQTEDGPRLGVSLRQGIGGIGTVTWYDPARGTFGALGHGVNDPSGRLLDMKTGTAYTGLVEAVVRGRSGHPGQLKGAAGESCGELLRNTPRGLFGKAAQEWPGEPIPAAQLEQLHTGSAVIRSTVCGDTPRDYTVEILKLYPAQRTDGRNLLLKVTDPALLEATGGIVQGMSGSPILQDGCLVGAVTHVLVNDPTMGYGIFIGNMLEANHG